jgi:predicted RNA-binding Zn ribbon-like protein
MRGTIGSPEDLRLLGGSLPLDFVNSIDWRATDRPVEYLDGYEALLIWSLRLATLDPEEVATLRTIAARAPAPASAAIARLKRQREHLYELFRAIATDQRPQPLHLDAVRRWYVSAVGAGTLRENDTTIALDWPDDRLERPGWPIALAAWNLLTDDVALARVKLCPAAGCGWLFRDRSKSGTRRWCSMDGCGARMKMRRAYARTRQ